MASAVQICSVLPDSDIKMELDVWLVQATAMLVQLPLSVLTAQTITIWIQLLIPAPRIAQKEHMETKQVEFACFANHLVRLVLPTTTHVLNANL